VVAPARVSPAVAARARAVAQRAVASLPGAIGIFGVELFLLADGSVVLNELAPRPHNSGHYTMEACVVDQFENHLRAVLGLPLGSGAMVAAHAIMVNVLGEDSMEGTLAPLNKVRDAKMGSAGVSVQAITDNSTNRSRVDIHLYPHCFYFFFSEALQNGHGGIHWYGKASSRAGRKMAHVTFCGPSAAAVQRSAEAMGIASVSAARVCTK
jgi:phosphoribosylaminoimidazole carboxylase